MRHLGNLVSEVKAHKEKKSLGKALSISVLNQLVSSGTNFLFGIYLVRTLTPTDFGLFGIGLAICLFYTGAGNALFLTQMVVHSPDKPEDDRIPYAGRIFLAVLGTSTITLLLATSLILLGKNIWSTVSTYADYYFLVAAVSASMFVKDFFVRHAYNQRKEHWALRINTTLALVMAAQIAALHYLVPSMTVEKALTIYTICQMLAAVYGYYLSRPPLRREEFSGLPDAIKEAWKGGSFSILAHIIITIRTQAHTIILAATTGPAGLAAVNAARIFVTPVTVLMPALAQIFLPRLAEARTVAPDSGKKDSATYSWLMTLIVFGYSIFILGFYESIHSLVTGDKYGALYSIVLGWCAYTALTAYRSGIEIYWIAQKRFKAQALFNFIGAIISLFTVYLLSSAYGYEGAVAGLSLAELAVILAMHTQQHRLGVPTNIKRSRH